MAHHANGDGLTVRQRILNLLADGREHSKEEIHSCLYDELAPISNIYQHITLLRRILRPKGQDVIGNYRGGYRLVRIVASPYDGRK